jgi:phosphatidate cytidylyltransferase
MLRTRIITALIALPIVVAGTLAGGLWFLMGAGIIGLIAGWEFSQLMRVGGYRTTFLFILALICLLLLDAYYPRLLDTYYPGLRLLHLIITVTLVFSLVWQLFRADSATPTADWALTLAGGLYIGWGMAHLVALRQLADGLTWVWLTFFSTWGADTFAYFVGRAIGRHRLWPRHSPKKTWEGLFGGIGGGLACAAIVIALSPNLSWGSGLLIGAIIPIVGLFGDLAISMIKRDVGVKDASQLFPGHGGFLDRIDSILLVSIIVYYYAVWIG